MFILINIEIYSLLFQYIWVSMVCGQQKNNIRKGFIDDFFDEAFGFMEP